MRNMGEKKTISFLVFWKGVAGEDLHLCFFLLFLVGDEEAVSYKSRKLRPPAMGRLCNNLVNL